MMARSKKIGTLDAAFMTSIPLTQTRSSMTLKKVSKSGAMKVSNATKTHLGSSKITSKGQITLPKPVRAYLGGAEGDRVNFREVDGKIVVESIYEEDDPAIAAFLNVLTKSISDGHAVALPADLVERMQSLTAGIAVDLDAAIEGEVAI